MTVLRIVEAVVLCLLLAGLNGCGSGDTIEGCRDAVIATSKDNSSDPNITTDQMPECDGLSREDQIEAVDQAMVTLLDDFKAKMEEAFR